MEQKETKEEGVCGSKCKITKNHIIWILSVLLAIATVSAISLALCKEGRGFRGGSHMKYMMEGKYDNEGGRYMQGAREGLLQGAGVSAEESAFVQPKRSPDVIPTPGSPVDILPTSPTPAQ